MSDSEAAATTDDQTQGQGEHQAGGEFADPNATVTCTTCLAEIKPDNIGKHFNWHVDVGDHTDDAQREGDVPPED
ncbi:hypothetical protein H5V45_14545 [Nocardioides sp. KIGAM211]|uniref:Uncharacterized protein n=1 Tax=Nocardioides luti TaxID=2761101 RepID=A0A7X0VBD4_9ACTN|nr:hypothetical protein [Nocardioides luti]MBB6628541.1 hypothetical protein [Nocardioides luti]